jgi:hypothetical protein
MAAQYLELDRQTLARHLSAKFTIPGAALPYPQFDPNPRLTFALHELWEVLYPFVAVDNQMPIFARPPGNNLSRVEAFERIRPVLVSHFFISFYHRDVLLTFICS